ncbi:MAG: LysR substrate-binding domain-containing protein [Burkholderiales bacterium]
MADLRGMKQGEVRIAIGTSAEYFIPDVAGAFLAQYPEVDVRLEIANHEKMLERVEANRDDLYVMVSPPEDPGIERIPYVENPLAVIAPRAHPLTREKAIPIACISRERFIAREIGSRTHMRISRFMAEKGYQLDVRMEFGSNEAVKHAVAQGLRSASTAWRLV